MESLKLTKKYERYPEYKDSGVEWLGAIPKDWSFRRLKFFIKNMESGSRKNIEEVSEDSVPSIGGEHITDGKVLFLDNKYISREYYQKLRKGKIRKNDILMIKDGATIGKAAFVDVLHSEMALNEHVYLIRSNSREVVQKYLYYVMISGKVQSLISLETRGSAQGGLNTSFTSNIFHEMPALSEQVRIVEYLDTKLDVLNQVIDRKRIQIELLKEKRTAVINEAVTKGLSPNVELVDSGIDWIRQIPKGWELRRLKFLGEAIIGLTYSPDDVVAEDGTLVLRSSNVQDGKITLKDNVYVKKNISRKLITKKGDILICARNGSRALIGKNALIDERSLGLSFGAFMTVFRSKYFEYISCFLKSDLFISQLTSTLTSTINQLTTHYLNNILIVLPSENEQKEIAFYIKGQEEIHNKAISSINKSIQLLQEFKSSLISNVVTGKIKV